MNQAQKTYAEQTFNYALKMYGDAVLLRAKGFDVGDNVSFWQNQVDMCAYALAAVS
jgi:hypothetical protein